MQTNIQKSKYRADIDGLRAIAVIAVIINHFDKNLLPSGYLGVDIFFVISGFVITSSLADRKSKNFSDFISGFFERRVKRLIPALIPFTLITGILICFFNPTPRASLLTGITSLFGLSNFYLLNISTDYFADSTLLNAFTHTWSLDVEEQFYLVFPFLIWFTGFGRKTKDGTRNLKFISILLIVLSFISYLFLYQRNQSAAYFLMPTRFWEMSVGCLTFLVVRDINYLNIKLLKSINLAVFFLLIVIFLFPETFSPLATTLIVFLTSILIISIYKDSKIYNFLVNKNILHIGKISYSLYLWHWTVLCISRWTVGIHIWTVPIQLFLMYFLALISYKFIEIPFRDLEWSFKRFKTILKGVLALIFSASVLFLFEKPLGKKLFLGKYTPELNSDEFLSDIKCSNESINFDQLKLKENCMITSPIRKNIIAVGDSQTRHLVPILKKINSENQLGIFYQTKTGTSFPPINEKAKGKNINKLNERISQNQYLLSTYNYFLENSNPGDIVLFSSRYELRWSDYSIPLSQRNVKRIFFDKNKNLISKDKAFEEWKKQFYFFINELKSRDLNVVLFSSFPTFPKDYKHLTNPQWFNGINNAKNQLQREFLKKHYFKIDKFLIELSYQYSNVYYFDIFNNLCPENQKICNQNDKFSDSWHLSKKGALSIYPVFVDFLKVNNLL